MVKLIPSHVCRPSATLPGELRVLGMAEEPTVTCPFPFQFDEVIDDIMRLDDVLGYMNPEVHMPNTLPMSSSHMNVYSGDPQVTASLVGVTSSSCPAELTQKRELTDAESRALAKERQKKDNHNLSEFSSAFPITLHPHSSELGPLPIPADPQGSPLSPSLLCDTPCVSPWQELEMQARVHGLPTSSPSGVNVAELAQQVVKQEASGDEGTLEPLLPPPEAESQAQPALPVPPQSPYHQLDFTHSLSFDDGSFPDSLEPSSSFPSLSKKELDLMLMQDTMLPLASDPLFSAMSPEASKASSRRSSFSMEDADML
uniref:MiT/TFE transcription factors C-terminal domain-containing protein n=1 Tax=Zonotrichia albicollis TaxID=44394 RepID=A0A8D2MBP4_ZONAL